LAIWFAVFVLDRSAWWFLFWALIVFGIEQKK